MRPLVSIVLPVRNPHPIYFREAVESVLAQTHPAFELIIVEDPSPVSGATILRDITDVRIQHLRNGEATSLPEQHNRGLSLARGAYICRFDADDVCEPDRLRTEVDFLQRHPEVSVVSSALLIIDESGEPVAVRTYPLSHEEIRRTFRRSNPIANSAVMFRRDVYDRFGGWRTDSPLPAQDYEWYSRLAAAGVRFANLPEPLVRYRVHGGSMKSTKLRDTIRSTLQTKHRYWLREMGWIDRTVMLAERLLLRLPPRLVFALFARMRYRRV